MKTTKWTTNDIPNLTGKTIIVTGGNSGLGYEAVKAFAGKNATLILASRSKERGEEAKKTILSNYPKAQIEVMALDLADLSSIHHFADEYKKRYNALDVLLNNAGIMWCPYNKTKDGFESQMGVNHLGHFALTGLLLEHLKTTQNSRVVTVSSMGHRSAKLDINNILLDEENYNSSLAYFNSKLANLLFAYELQRKFEQHHINCMSLAAHPGGSATNLARHVEKSLWFKLMRPLFAVIAQSAAIGTLPEVRASVDPNAKGGEYYGPRGFNEMRGYPVLVSSTPESHNLTNAKKLWDTSEQLTGITYNF